MKKNILITGSSGFVGSHILDEYLKKNIKVYAIYRYSKKNINFVKKYKKKFVPIFYKSISEIKKKLSNYKIDYVIHSATHYIKKHKHKDIKNIIESNVLFSAVLLDAVVDIKIKKFINLGTVWQHFNGTKNFAFNFYAATKQSFECIFNYYKNQYPKIKFYNILLTDTFGANDKRKKLVPELIKNFKNNNKTKIPKNLSMNLVDISDVQKSINILVNSNIKPDSYVVKSKKDIKIFSLINSLNRNLKKKINVKWLKNVKNYKTIKLKNLLQKEKKIYNQILKLFNENN